MDTDEAAALKERVPEDLSEPAQEALAALCKLEAHEAAVVVRLAAVVHAWTERMHIQAEAQRPLDGSVPDESAWREWYGDLGPVEREAELLIRELPQIKSISAPLERKKATDEWTARYDALQAKRRAAIGINDHDWNAGSNVPVLQFERQDKIYTAALETYYEKRWQRQARRPGREFDVERLSRFYSGPYHIDEVDQFADLFTDLVGARYQLASSSIPATLKSRILAFAECLTQARMQSSSEKWPDLPRLGRMIDALLADTANPAVPAVPRGKARRDKLPPGYRDTAAERRRLSTTCSDVKTTPWRKIAQALGSAEESERIRSEWTEIMYAALESIERART